MVFTGFAWFAGLLVDATPPWLNTIGLAVQAVWIIGLVYLLIGHPLIASTAVGRGPRLLARARAESGPAPPGGGEVPRSGNRT
jgi:hypothetical protein